MARSWSETGTHTVPSLLMRVAVLLTTSSWMIGDATPAVTAARGETHRRSERLGEAEDPVGVVGALDAQQALRVLAVIGPCRVLERRVVEVRIDAAGSPRVDAGPRARDPSPRI